ncbi:MAG: Gfo/Idh/MocA family oxidoreductase [Candidatus Sumerlaeota bacterium]|nr:Gfo/Idh/MocA family oxidoreductase [Candidatus Sumerlaeota bacterium]
MIADNTRRQTTRRRFLGGALAAAAAPYILPASALGRDTRPAPSNRLTVGCIGIGGRGAGDAKTFMGFDEVQIVAVCDVRKDHLDQAKATVDQHYGGASCSAHNDFREITSRPDIDAVMIATPDHWHAVIAIDAMRHGKDVFCEKPETLTVREGRAMVEAARRYGRVFSGGSQRVWGDYNYFHRMVRGGALGEVKEAWVNVSAPSKPCALPGVPVTPGLDWDMWLGPAPWAAFNPQRLVFRAWRDYSGGGMTDWGAHVFGGALFACNLHETGPIEIIPPDGKEHEFLTYVFANGIRIYHAPDKINGRLKIKGTKAEIEGGDAKRLPPPNINIPNYKGTGGLVGDFLHCVRTRQEPFRNIEVAHRAVTVCHLGNIAYWLNRPLKWDPAKEEIIGDEEASRWLSRPKRAPWHLV